MEKQIQNMDIHRGKWLKNMIKEKEYLVKQVAVVTGDHSSNLTRYFSMKNMPFKKMKQICDVIDVDLYHYFPEAKKIVEILSSEEQSWKDKFLKISKKLTDLRGQHDNLRRKHAALSKEYDDLKAQIEGLNRNNTEEKITSVSGRKRDIGGQKTVR